MSTIPYVEPANPRRPLSAITSTCRPYCACGRFTGRIGVLAIAPRPGAAIANSAVITAADIDQATTSEASSTDSESPNSRSAAEGGIATTTSADCSSTPPRYSPRTSPESLQRA